MRPGRKIRDRSRVAVAKRRARRRLRSKGLCTFYCGRKAEPGRVLCRICHRKSVARTREWVAARIAAGLCRECGWPATRGTRCLTCRTKRKARRGWATQRPHQPPWTPRATGGRSSWLWIGELQL